MVSCCEIEVPFEGRRRERDWYVPTKSAKAQVVYTRIVSYGLVSFPDHKLTKDGLGTRLHRPTKSMFEVEFAGLVYVFDKKRQE